VEASKWAGTSAVEIAMMTNFLNILLLLLAFGQIALKRQILNIRFVADGFCERAFHVDDANLNDANYPVVWISWVDAVKYCA
jgi:hypothetical protein